MSRTNTTTEQQTVLEDYKIHLTSDNSSSETETAAATPNTTVSNPSNWPTGYHRIPKFRPADRNREAAERPNGENRFETVFLTIMFTGVVTNSVRFYSMK